MKEIAADKKADILTDGDRGEPVLLMTPTMVGEAYLDRGALTDLTVAPAAKSGGLRRSLPAGVLNALASLGRSIAAAGCPP